MLIIFFCLLLVLGSCFGSFLCCQARRLHHKDAKRESLGRRSVCLHCHHQLRWYDNLPVISWLSLKGKCRYCRHRIGLAELLSELGLGCAFLLVGVHFVINHGGQLSMGNISAFTPLDWSIFITTLAFVSIAGFLAIYDGLYGELPSLYLALAILGALLIRGLEAWSHLLVHPFDSSLIYNPLLAVLILGGLYLLLHFVSKGRWVGDGDWLLGTALALALGTPWLALIALFAANLLACIVMYPVVKSHKEHHIHFGPFLVMAYIIVLASSEFLQTII